MRRYNLVFSGEISHGFDSAQVKKNFKNRFHLTDIQIRHIFSGRNIILKKNLSQEKTLKYASIIDEIGGISYFEPNTETYLPLGVKDDRRLDNRRKRPDRRKSYRAGHTADRRFHPERRLAV